MQSNKVIFKVIQIQTQETKSMPVRIRCNLEVQRPIKDNEKD